MDSFMGKGGLYGVMVQNMKVLLIMVKFTVCHSPGSECHDTHDLGFGTKRFKTGRVIEGVWVHGTTATIQYTGNWLIYCRQAQRKT